MLNVKRQQLRSVLCLSRVLCPRRLPQSRSFPHRQCDEELPLPVQVISRKEIEESRAGHCRKLSTMWGAASSAGRPSLKTQLKILEDS